MEKQRSRNIEYKPELKGKALHLFFKHFIGENLTKDFQQVIRRKRRVYATDKIVDFGGHFIEHHRYEGYLVRDKDFNPIVTEDGEYVYESQGVLIKPKGDFVIDYLDEIKGTEPSFKDIPLEVMREIFKLDGELYVDSEAARKREKNEEKFWPRKMPFDYAMRIFLPYRSIPLSTYDEKGYERYFYIEPDRLEAVNNGEELPQVVKVDDGKVNMEFEYYALAKDNKGKAVVVDMYGNYRSIRYEKNFDWFIEEAPVEEFKETPLVLARKSARRAYQKIKELSMTNLDKFDAFITLTFAPEEKREKHIENGLELKYVNRHDYDSIVSAFGRFKDNINKKLKKAGYPKLEYIAVWEKHWDGAYHFHLLCSAIPESFLQPVPAFFDKKHGKRRYGVMIKDWVYGLSDYELLRDKEKSTTYISKYIGKTLERISEVEYLEFANRKKYFSSGGLAKPTVQYFEHVIPANEKVEEALANYTDIYVATYANPYSDKIIVKTTFSKKNNDEDNY